MKEAERKLLRRQLLEALMFAKASTIAYLIFELMENSAFWLAAVARKAVADALSAAYIVHVEMVLAGLHRAAIGVSYLVVRHADRAEPKGDAQARGALHAQRPDALVHPRKPGGGLRVRHAALPTRGNLGPAVA